MAQEKFFSDDEFGVDTSADAKEFESWMNDAPITADPKTVTPATPEDKKKEQEKQSGEQKSQDDKAAEAEALRKKEEEETRKWVEGDEQEGDEGKDNKSQKTKSEKKEEEPIEVEGIELLAQDLYKAGIFTKDEEDEEAPETTEEFIDKFNWEKQKAAEGLVYNLLGRHGEDYREALEAILVNGVHPQEYLSRFEQVTSFKEMDMTDESNQEKVVEAALKNQQWEPADIRDEIKKLKLNSDLESTSQKYHKALVKTEEQNLVRMQEEAKIKLEQKKLQDTQKATNIRTILADKIKKQDFDGIPVNRDLAQKTIDFFEKKNWKLPSGELITDYQYALLELERPQNHETMLKIGMLLAKDFEPGKPLKLDFGPIEKKAVSKENSELFNWANQKKKSQAKGNKEEKKPELQDFLSGL